MLDRVELTHRYEYLIAGAGPNGLTALSTLLANGVDPKDILIVDADCRIFSEDKSETKFTRYSVAHIADLERPTRGLGKSGRAIKKTELFPSPSFSWGVSNFEISDHSLEEWGLDVSKFNLYFDECMDEFEVQTNTGKTRGTKRKKLAEGINKRNPNLSHSWLALSSSGTTACSLAGGCFHGCGNDAPMNPKKVLNNLQDKWGKINYINSRITEIDFEKLSVQTTNHTIISKKIILCLGANATKDIIEQNLKTEIVLKTTPVILTPFLVDRRNSYSEFVEHFNYTDLILSIADKGKIMAFCQIYLPTVEIAGRIIATLPWLAHQILRNLSGTMAYKLFSRVGICMIFLPQTSIESNSENARENFLRYKKRIWLQFRKSGLLPLPFPRKYLLHGESHHLGAMAGVADHKSGFQSNVWELLASKDIYVLDTSALPEIQPGPHTLISAALCRYLIKEMKI